MRNNKKNNVKKCHEIQSFSPEQIFTDSDFQKSIVC